MREDGILRYSRRLALDPSRLARLTLDLLVFADELRLYLTGTHSQPANITDLFCPIILSCSVTPEPLGMLMNLEQASSVGSTADFQSAETTPVMARKYNNNSAVDSNCESQVAKVDYNKQLLEQSSTSEEDVTLHEDRDSAGKNKTIDQIDANESTPRTSIASPSDANCERHSISTDLTSLPDLQSVSSLPPSRMSYQAKSVKDSIFRNECTPLSSPEPQNQEHLLAVKREDHIYEEIGEIRAQVKKLRSSVSVPNLPPPLPPKTRLQSSNREAEISVDYSKNDWSTSSMGGSTGRQRRKRRAPLPPSFMGVEMDLLKEAKTENTENDIIQNFVEYAPSQEVCDDNCNPFYEEIGDSKPKLSHEAVINSQSSKDTNNPFHETKPKPTGFVGTNPFYEDISKAKSSVLKEGSKTENKSDDNSISCIESGIGYVSEHSNSLLLPSEAIRPKRRAPKIPKSENGVMPMKNSSTTNLTVETELIICSTDDGSTLNRQSEVKDKSTVGNASSIIEEDMDPSDNKSEIKVLRHHDENVTSQVAAINSNGEVDGIITNNMRCTGNKQIENNFEDFASTPITEEKFAQDHLVQFEENIKQNDENSATSLEIAKSIETKEDSHPVIIEASLKIVPNENKRESDNEISHVLSHATTFFSYNEVQLEKTEKTKETFDEKLKLDENTLVAENDTSQKVRISTEVLNHSKVSPIPKLSLENVDKSEMKESKKYVLTEKETESIKQESFKHIKSGCEDILYIDNTDVNKYNQTITFENRTRLIASPIDFLQNSIPFIDDSSFSQDLEPPPMPPSPPPFSSTSPRSVSPPETPNHSPPHTPPLISQTPNHSPPDTPPLISQTSNHSTHHTPPLSQTCQDSPPYTPPLISQTTNHSPMHTSPLISHSEIELPEDNEQQIKQFSKICPKTEMEDRIGNKIVKDGDECKADILFRTSADLTRCEKRISSAYYEIPENPEAPPPLPMKPYNLMNITTVEKAPAIPPKSAIRQLQSTPTLPPKSPRVTSLDVKITSPTNKNRFGIPDLTKHTNALAAQNQVSTENDSEIHCKFSSCIYFFIFHIESFSKIINFT